MKVSFTQWKMYKQCPMQYDRVYRQQVCRAEESEAARSGRLLHEALEHWLVGRTEALPEAIGPSWRPLLEDLRGRCETERRFENDIAVGVVDCLRDGLIVDFKTGRPRAGDLLIREQLSFYAWLVGFEDAVTCQLWYVCHPRKPSSFYCREYKGCWKLLDRIWRSRLAAMTDDAPNPGWWCRYCPVEDCAEKRV